MTLSNAQSDKPTHRDSEPDKEPTTKVTPTKEAAPAKKSAPKSDEPTYTHERLIQECTVAVGYRPDTIAGALVGVSDKELTIKQAKAACEQWLKAEQR